MSHGKKLATISVEGLEVECIIGILPAERELSQWVLVDVALDYDIAAAAKSDDFKKTVDYVAMADVVSGLLIERKYQLLETFVVDAADLLLRQFEGERVRLKVMKPNAIEAASWTAVEFEQRR